MDSEYRYLKSVEKMTLNILSILIPQNPKERKMITDVSMKRARF